MATWWKNGSRWRRTTRSRRRTLRRGHAHRQFSKAVQLDQAAKWLQTLSAVERVKYATSVWWRIVKGTEYGGGK